MPQETFRIVRSPKRRPPQSFGRQFAGAVAGVCLAPISCVQQPTAPFRGSAEAGLQAGPGGRSQARQGRGPIYPLSGSGPRPFSRTPSSRIEVKKMNEKCLRVTQWRTNWIGCRAKEGPTYFGNKYYYSRHITVTLDLVCLAWTGERCVFRNGPLRTW